MIDSRHFLKQHRRLLRQARELAGCAAGLRSHRDAVVVRNLIEDIDSLLSEHLTHEDAALYPTLAGSPDPQMRRTTIEAVEDMGALHGGWSWYRDHWTLNAILGDPGRFKTATGDIVGALSLRIEKEEAELYPAFDALLVGRDVNRAA